MKKLIITISIFFTLISLAEARECKSGDIKGDAFIYSDGKKVTVIKGTDIPNPENKIIMIFNTGGWKVEKKWGECKDFLPKQLGQISGTKIKGKELVLMLNRISIKQVEMMDMVVDGNSKVHFTNLGMIVF